MQPIIVRADFSKAIILRLFGRAADWLLLHKPFTRAKGAALDARPESHGRIQQGVDLVARDRATAPHPLCIWHTPRCRSAAQRAAQIKISRLSPCLQIHLEYMNAQKTLRIANCHYICCCVRWFVCWMLNYYWSDRLLTVRTQQRQPIILHLWWLCANSHLEHIIHSAYWQGGEEFYQCYAMIFINYCEIIRYATIY